MTKGTWRAIETSEAFEKIEQNFHLGFMVGLSTRCSETRKRRYRLIYFPSNNPFSTSPSTKTAVNLIQLCLHNASAMTEAFGQWISVKKLALRCFVSPKNKRTNESVIKKKKKNQSERVIKWGIADKFNAQNSNVSTLFLNRLCFLNWYFLSVEPETRVWIFLLFLFLFPFIFI